VDLERRGGVLETSRGAAEAVQVRGHVQLRAEGWRGDALWDGKVDGKHTVQWENQTIQCIATVYWLAI
jgi:hypothetical protein